jgi:hypothetical protein
VVQGSHLLDLDDAPVGNGSGGIGGTDVFGSGSPPLTAPGKSAPVGGGVSAAAALLSSSLNGGGSGSGLSGLSTASHTLLRAGSSGTGAGSSDIFAGAARQAHSRQLSFSQSTLAAAPSWLAEPESPVAATKAASGGIGSSPASAAAASSGLSTLLVGASPTSNGSSSGQQQDGDHHASTRHALHHSRSQCVTCFRLSPVLTLVAQLRGVAYSCVFVRVFQNVGRFRQPIARRS